MFTKPIDSYLHSERVRPTGVAKTLQWFQVSGVRCQDIELIDPET